MPADPPVIEFLNVTKAFGDVLAVDHVNLRVTEGEFLSFLGPSGCGKTTSLRLIAGFEQPTSGDVRIAGQSVVGVPAYQRPVNMVFQSYALFPHLSVFDNIAFGLRQQRPKPSLAELAKAVDAALELVRLQGYGTRRIHELSGGQQQRVALARALINRPKVLLLDEPLAALDRKLRRDMQIELQNLQAELGITFVLVTHDQEEALSMSDRVCIMRQGRIVQMGRPRELYDEPVNRYVADFVGKSNFLQGRVEAAGAIHLAAGAPARARRPAGAQAVGQGQQAWLAVRPETMRMARAEAPLSGLVEQAFSGLVRNRIFLGEHTEYLVEVEGLGGMHVLTPRLMEQATSGYEPGERVFVGWPQDQALLLTDN